MLGYAGASPNGPGTSAAVRLNSSYVYSDAVSMRRYRLGDFINGGLAWTRPLRLGGAEINSDFSMRPDLVTFPLPTLGGSAAVPSTVDVLVNGTRLLSRDIQPGPFQVPQLPVVTGAGTVTMTVTNPLGRQVTTTLPVYASTALLAPGLQSYALEVGAVRRNWGLVSNDYGDPVGSATYRRGVLEWLTVEGHAEGGSGVAMGGGGVAVNVANLGVVNFAVAGSGARGESGMQLAAGAQRVGRVFSAAVSATVASSGFRDVAAMNGTPVARLQLDASSGLSLGRYGSVGVAYTGVDRSAAAAPIRVFAPPGTFLPETTVSGGTFTSSGDQVTFTPAQHVHLLSVSWSVQVRNVAVYATGFHDFANARSNGLLLGFTVPIGPRSSVSAGGGATSGGGYGQVAAQQTAVTIGDVGYQAYASAGRPDHAFAELDYKSPWALLSAGADRIDNQSSGRAEAQGALSFADRAFFASNTINDSFAVVDTDGAPNIRVTSENRDAGRTDASGKLLLPELRSFDVNRIAIEPTDVPIDATVPTVSREVRPQDRSGVVVRFPVHTSHGALLRLVDEAGRPLPLGSAATLRETGATTAVGYDGQAYVEGLAAHNTLAVEQPNGRRCTVAFDYTQAAGDIPVLGPLPCRERTAMRRALALFALGLFLPLAPAAHANAPSCTVSATPVSFGLYVPTLGTPTDSTGTVSVDCAWSIGFSVALSTGASGSYSTRQMRNGTARLSYQLYADAARTDGMGKWFRRHHPRLWRL